MLCAQQLWLKHCVCVCVCRVPSWHPSLCPCISPYRFCGSARGVHDFHDVSQHHRAGCGPYHRPIGGSQHPCWHPSQRHNLHQSGMGHAGMLICSAMLCLVSWVCVCLFNNRCCYRSLIHYFLLIETFWDILSCSSVHQSLSPSCVHCWKCSFPCRHYAVILCCVRQRVVGGLFKILLSLLIEEANAESASKQHCFHTGHAMCH